MPKREDDYFASNREPGGRALCPYCGSSDIYFNEYYRSWRCAKCEKSFPMPSYGSGTWFGSASTPPDDNPFDPEHPGYYKGEWKKSKGNIVKSFSRILSAPIEILSELVESLQMLRWLVLVAVIVGIAFGVVYLMTEHQNPTDIEKGILEQINMERNKAGLNLIAWDESLHLGAREHSEYMAEKGMLFHATGYFSECVFSSTSSVMGIDFPGYPDAKITVKSWMDSPGHRSILLGNEYTVGAVGVSKKGYATYRCR
jgi:hypothetical protein